MTRDTALAGLAGGIRSAGLLAGVVCVALVAACAEEPPARAELTVSPRSTAESDLLGRMLAAEDARASTEAELAPLMEGVASPIAGIRRIAVRSLGRLEREALVPRIQPLLEDPDAGVRVEAANAMAQAVLRADPGAAVAPVRAALLERLALEPDAGVRGALAQSAGRTRHATGAQAAATAEAIVDAAGAGSPSLARDPAVDVRVAKGLYFLARQPAARGALPDAAVGLLRDLMASRPEGAGASGPAASRTRTLAVAALAAAARATAADLAAAFGDPDPLVRREAVAAAPALEDGAAARALLARGVEDPAPAVRYDALRGWGRLARGDDCRPVGAAARDPDGHVALLAIDLLADCPALPGAPDLLDSLVLTLPSDPSSGEWHRAAHALVSLAALNAARATERLLPFVAHESPFVRAYAASTAAALGEPQTLRLLARDPNPNVRVAALAPLATLEGRSADALLVEQLDGDDPQLLMTAAGLLEGTEDPTALPALLGALDRVTERRRETERDARMALLERIEPLGGAADVERIRPLLRDFDPAVAQRAADLVGAWTGARPEPSPEPLPPTPVPTPDRLDALATTSFVVEMDDGGAFELRLLAWDAPTNADRFARLAESGYFDGLTYHRVVPNFVVQGGSPEANEYAGDGPFSRDELGIDGNWRGTVGLSTRGRDTGDGQMFINTVDNVRLDHEYTVFAEIVSGMDVVDRLQEGATILRIRRGDAP